MHRDGWARCPEKGISVTGKDPLSINRLCFVNDLFRLSFVSVHYVCFHLAISKFLFSNLMERVAIFSHVLPHATLSHILPLRTSHCTTCAHSRPGKIQGKKSLGHLDERLALEARVITVRRASLGYDWATCYLCT